MRLAVSEFLRPRSNARRGDTGRSSPGAYSDPLKPRSTWQRRTTVPHIAAGRRSRLPVASPTGTSCAPHGGDPSFRARSCSCPAPAPGRRGGVDDHQFSSNSVHLLRNDLRSSGGRGSAEVAASGARSKLFAATGRCNASPRTMRLSRSRDAATATMAGLSSRPICDHAFQVPCQKGGATGDVEGAPWGALAGPPQPGRPRHPIRDGPALRTGPCPSTNRRTPPPACRSTPLWPCPSRSVPKSRSGVFHAATRDPGRADEQVKEHLPV